MLQPLNDGRGVSAGLICMAGRIKDILNMLTNNYQMVDDLGNCIFT